MLCVHDVQIRWGSCTLTASRCWLGPRGSQRHPRHHHRPGPRPARDHDPHRAL